jgi:Transposase
MTVLPKLASARKELLSLWDHPTVTAGFTEAMNGQVKHIVRLGRGYAFPELKRRFMQGYTPAPRDPRKKRKIRPKDKTYARLPAVPGAGLEDTGRSDRSES